MNGIARVENRTLLKLEEKSVDIANPARVPPFESSGMKRHKMKKSFGNELTRTYRLSRLHVTTIRGVHIQGVRRSSTSLSTSSTFDRARIHHICLSGFVSYRKKRSSSYSLNSIVSLMLRLVVLGNTAQRRNLKKAMRVTCYSSIYIGVWRTFQEVLIRPD